MATVGTFCTSGAVMFKAGKNVGVISEANMNTVINEAESFINTQARVDFSGAWADLNDEVKYLVSDAANCHAAVCVIGYDMSGYTSKAEAQTMLDINWARMQEDLQLLKDKKHVDFMEE